MRVIIQNEQKFAWETWTWVLAIGLCALTIVPLVFGIIGLIEGAGEAIVPIAVSALAAILFTFFVGRQRVCIDKSTGEILVEFQSLLRKTRDVGDLHRLEEVRVYEETGESAPVVVDPKSRPSTKGVRYRAAITFDDGTELNLNGTASKGSESHRIARALNSWLEAGDSGTTAV